MMQKDFPKLFFICSVICLIFSLSFATVNLFFPQYLNSVQTVSSPIDQPDSMRFSSAQTSSNNMMSDVSPLFSWLVPTATTDISSLDQFQILGVSFVMGTPHLSRVILSKSDQLARTYAQGTQVAEGVIVDQIFAKGVQLRSIETQQTKILLLLDQKDQKLTNLNQVMTNGMPIMPETYNPSSILPQTSDQVSPEMWPQMQPNNQ